MSKILFIGAGASLGAREGFSKRPPLGKDLLSWLRETTASLLGHPSFIDLESALSSGAIALNKNLIETNFETLIPSLEYADRPKLQKLLQICFSDLSTKDPSFDFGFNTSRDGYDALIEVLNLSAEDWIIVSLNYDVLLEQALSRADIPFHYVGFPFVPRAPDLTAGSLPIFKPHGSINFMASAEIGVSFGGPDSDLSGIRPMTFYRDQKRRLHATLPKVYALKPVAADILAEAPDWRVSKVVIANYTMGKDSDVNFETLNYVRAQAIKKIKEAKTMFTVGVRPITDSNDDPFVSAAISHAAPEYFYIGKNLDECMLIKKLHPHSTIFDEGVGGFFNSFAKR